METYEVRVSPGGSGWWVIEVPALRGGWSQARRLKDVEPMARDLVANLLEVPEDSFELSVTSLADQSTEPDTVWQRRVNESIARLDGDPAMRAKYEAEALAWTEMDVEVFDD